MSDAQQSEVASSAATEAAEAAENAIQKVLTRKESFDFEGAVESVALLLASFGVNTATHMTGQKTEGDLSYAIGYLDMVYKAAKDKVVGHFESAER